MTAFQNIRNLTNGGAAASTSLQGNQIQEQTASDANDSIPPPLPVEAPVILAQAKLQMDPTPTQQPLSPTTNSSCCSSSNPDLAQDSNEVEECCICL
jgi:hypothetical protein